MFSYEGYTCYCKSVLRSVGLFDSSRTFSTALASDMRSFRLVNALPASSPNSLLLKTFEMLHDMLPCDNYIECEACPAGGKQFYVGCVFHWQFPLASELRPLLAALATSSGGSFLVVPVRRKPAIKTSE